MSYQPKTVWVTPLSWPVQQGMTDEELQRTKTMEQKVQDYLRTNPESYILDIARFGKLPLVPLGYCLQRMTTAKLIYSTPGRKRTSRVWSLLGQ